MSGDILNPVGAEAAIIHLDKLAGRSGPVAYIALSNESNKPFKFVEAFISCVVKNSKSDFWIFAIPLSLYNISATLEPGLSVLPLVIQGFERHDAATWRRNVRYIIGMTDTRADEYVKKYGTEQEADFAEICKSYVKSIRTLFLNDLDDVDSLFSRQDKVLDFWVHYRILVPGMVLVEKSIKITAAASASWLANYFSED